MTPTPSQDPPGGRGVDVMTMTMAGGVGGGTRNLEHICLLVDYMLPIYGNQKQPLIFQHILAHTHTPHLIIQFPKHVSPFVTSSQPTHRKHQALVAYCLGGFYGAATYMGMGLPDLSCRCIDSFPWATHSLQLRIVCRLLS